MEASILLVIVVIKINTNYAILKKFISVPPKLTLNTNSSTHSTLWETQWLF